MMSKTIPNAANPSKDRIDDYWTRLRIMLAKLDGDGAATLLLELRDNDSDDDTMLWNALYWRTNNWLKDYFARKPVSTIEAQNGMNIHSIGFLRLTLFLNEIYPDRTAPDHWNTADLRYILQVLMKRETWRKENEA